MKDNVGGGAKRAKGWIEPEKLGIGRNCWMDQKMSSGKKQAEAKEKRSQDQMGKSTGGGGVDTLGFCLPTLDHGNTISELET